MIEEVMVRSRCQVCLNNPKYSRETETPGRFDNPKKSCPECKGVEWIMKWIGMEEFCQEMIESMPRFP